MLQPKRVNKVKPTLPTTKTPESDEEREWLVNWYSKRTLPDEQLNKDYQEEKSKYVERAKQAPDPIIVKEIDKDPNIKGAYVAERDEIAITETAPKLAYLHEASHSVTDRLRDTKSSMTAYTEVTKNIRPQNKVTDKWAKKNYKYLSNYNEVIPRLQAYRKHHNLQPDQEITPELIKENREKFAKPKVFGKEAESIEFEGNTDQLYKTFDDEGLSNVLNKVVTTENKKENIGEYGLSLNNTDMNNIKILRPTSIGGRKGKKTYTSGTTEVVKAASGAQILGAAAPFANFIPVVGPAVSAVMAGGAALWGASDAKRARRRSQLQGQAGQYNATTMEQDVYAKQFVDENRSDLPVYSKGGTMNNSYRTVKKYELGSTIEENQDVSLVNPNESSSTGKLEAVGGDLLPISDNAQVVSGNTHNENKIDGSYGVTLSANGQPIANVEDKEVVVNNDLVFSDKLKKGNKTFADIALDVNAKIGELQTKLKDAKSNAEKFSLQRTIQGLEKSNQDLFNEQEVVKSNTVGDEQEMVKVEDGIVPKGAKGMSLFNDPITPKNLDVYKAVVANNKYRDVQPVSELKPITYSNPLPTSTVGTIPTRNFNDYEKDLEGIGSKKSNVAGQLAPMLIDNIANAIITEKSPKPNQPTVRRAPVLETRVNVNPQLAKIAKAVGSSNAAIRGNTSNSAVARANITSANLRGAELSGDVLAKKEAAEREMRNRQTEATVANANANAQLQDDYREDVRQHTLEKGASQSRNIVNAVEDYKAVKQAELMDKSEQDIVNLSLMDDPTGEKMRTFKRLGKNLSNEDKIMLLREINRKK